MTRKHLVMLHRTLSTRFNESELRTLCFYLGIDYDDLPGDGKTDKARELIAYLERHDRMPELVKIVQQLRAEIRWFNR